MIEVRYVLLFWESVTSISGKKSIHIHLQHGVHLDTWLIHVEEELGDVAPEMWSWILALLIVGYPTNSRVASVSSSSEQEWLED